MSERVWLLEEGPDDAMTVYVLAWHETTATVVRLDDSGRVVPFGESPRLVESSRLRVGQPPRKNSPRLGRLLGSDDKPESQRAAETAA